MNSKDNIPPSQITPSTFSEDDHNGKPALGIITKLRTAQPKTQEAQRRVSVRFELLNAARDLLPKERVANCLRFRIDAVRPIEVLYSPDTASAHYGNVAACGSVWTCPVCSAKISERRRIELQEVVDTWLSQDRGIVLLTFTLQHRQGEDCEDVLDGLLEAHRDLWRYRAGIELRHDFGILGRVRSLEITHGGNGWHPHVHVLLFLGRKLSNFEAKRLRNQTSDLWSHILSKKARYASAVHGVDMRFADNEIADYVSKFGSDWSVAHEVAKSHVKVGTGKNRLPNNLLADYLQGDIEAGKLWQEYAKAFKGKTQLQWTKGFRSLIGLGENKTDLELVREQEQVAIPLARLDQDQWRLVLANDIRAELLIVAANGSQAGVKSFLEMFGIFGVQYPGYYRDG